MLKCLCASAVALFAFAGCGGGEERLETVPVSGKLYVDDAAHGPAALILYPVSQNQADQRPTVSAAVAADGSFTLMTYEEGDGAPPGKYQVNVTGQGGADDPRATADPSAMMSAAAPVSIEPTTVDIPAEGDENFEIRLKTSGEARPEGPGGMLGL